MRLAKIHIFASLC